jgi:hypothetical protein
MRGNFATGVVDRVARVIVFAAATPLIAAPLAFGQNSRQSDQYSDQMLAVRRCESELNFMMARDNGGRNPDANIDGRRGQAQQTSGTNWEVSGPGTYMRDSNDRGRPFTYTCRVDIRSGQVNARYQWAGNNGWDNEYDQANDGYPAPSTSRWGWGNRGASNASSNPPPGRVWASGGIISRSSGKGLDVEGRSTKDSANVQQWDFGGGANQKWDIIDLGRGDYAIVSQGSNKVLDVQNNSREDGASIVQYRWNGGDNQRWRIERAGSGYFQIVNVGSGKCLDVQGKGTDNGTNIQQWSCSGATNQAWKIQR